MIKKLLKTGAIVLCVLLLSVCIALLVYIDSVKRSDEYISFSKDRLNEVCSTITILDNDGQEIREALYYNDNKQIPLSALHDYTYMSFVAVEDKRFFQHNGIDTKRVLGAIVNNVKSGSFKEGASTISQQLIKNTHLNNNKNLQRKVNEMLLTLELERSYSKAEILEMYLNTIYFGRSAYGIESAANVYFDKSAADLTVAESAILAGMIKAPNNYAPDKDIEKCRNRRNLVLKLMLEQKIIDENAYNEATMSEIVYRPYTMKADKTYVYQVVDEACRLLNMTQSQLFHSEFIIETYCDSKIQNIVKSQATTDCTTNQDGSPTELACLICQNDGGVSACYFRGENCLRNKQIGSTAKPIAVYTPALCEKIISQASPVLDEPANFGGYCPTNVGGYCGWTTVKNAVAKSLNVPAVKTLNSLGVEKAEKYLEKFGITEKQNLSLALGNVTGGMNIHSLAKCYATLANDGICNDVAYIKKIYNIHGEVYSRKLQETRVYDNNSAYLMTDMLKNTVQNGTASRISDAKVITAAKTGTVGNSNGNSDALVAGYTTQHTYVFWYSGNLPNNVNGATAPCTFAADVLKNMYEKSKPADFKKPSDVVKLIVDKENLYDNQLVQLSDKGESFLFDNGNKPTVFVSKQEKYDYKLATTVNNGNIVFDLPDVAEKNWKIFKICDGSDVEVLSTDIKNGKYYAKLMQGETCVYTTPTIEVVEPTDTPPTYFWDFWVLPDLK